MHCSNTICIMEKAIKLGVLQKKALGISPFNVEGPKADKILVLGAFLAFIEMGTLMKGLPQIASKDRLPEAIPDFARSLANVMKNNSLSIITSLIAHITVLIIERRIGEKYKRKTLIPAYNEVFNLFVTKFTRQQDPSKNGADYSKLQNEINVSIKELNRFKASLIQTRIDIKTSAQKTTSELNSLVDFKDTIDDIKERQAKLISKLNSMLEKTNSSHKSASQIDSLLTTIISELKEIDINELDKKLNNTTRFIKNIDNLVKQLQNIRG